MKNQKTKFVILGLLSIKPLSGYDIKSLIPKTIGHFWAESNGQLYPMLSLLEKEALVELAEIQEKGKKAKKLYSITDQGRKELKLWLEDSSIQKNIHRDEGLLKLFFGGNVAKKEMILLLEQRKSKVLKELQDYLKIEEDIKKFSNNPQYVYWRIVLQNGIKSAQAELAWCEESLTQLEE